MIKISDACRLVSCIFCSVNTSSQSCVITTSDPTCWASLSTASSMANIDWLNWSASVPGAKLLTVFAPKFGGNTNVSAPAPPLRISFGPPMSVVGLLPAVSV